MIDSSWGIAVGGIGLGFGMVMLRSAAVVWSNNKARDRYVGTETYKATVKGIYDRLGALENKVDKIYDILLKG